MVTILYNKI